LESLARHSSRSIAKGTSIMIQLIEVTKVYEKGNLEVQALREVSLSIGEGGLISVRGPSGCGKSTLLNMIGLLDKPTRGCIKLFGRDTRLLRSKERARIRAKSIGFVFQSFNLIPTLSAWRNVALPLQYSRIHKQAQKERAARALAAVGLEDRANHFPSELSGGQEQRVAIARSLVIDPRLVLADEPTGNLDSSASADVMELFHNLREDGKTILVVTHDPSVSGHKAFSPFDTDLTARRMCRCNGGIPLL